MKKFTVFAFILALAVSLPAFSAPTCAVGVKGVAPVATITFTPPTLNTDGTPVATPLTFNLYQSTSTGTETKVASALAGSPISVSTGLSANTTYYWYVTTVDKNGTESAPSNEVCKSFPASVPATVTITVT